MTWRAHHSSGFEWLTSPLASGPSPNTIRCQATLGVKAIHPDCAGAAEGVDSAENVYPTIKMVSIGARPNKALLASGLRASDQMMHLLAADVPWKVTFEGLFIGLTLQISRVNDDSTGGKFFFCWVVVSRRDLVDGAMRVSPRGC